MMMSLCWQKIRQSLLLVAGQQRRDFIRNGGTAALLFVGADAIAQYVEHRNPNNNNNNTLIAQAKDDSINNHTIRAKSECSGWIIMVNSANASTFQQFLQHLDSWRCAGVVGLGVILGGAVYPTAYAQLDRWLPGHSWRTVVIKSAVEIVTVGIAVNTASLLARASWQGTHTAEAITAHCWTEIPRVTVVDAHVWFPYNLAAFGLIPIQIRPLTTACMEAGWQTYISLRAHDYPEQQGG